jgi:hypothetical protein
LGLLLAAIERWRAASEILEKGAEVGETDQDTEDDDVGSTGNPGTETDDQTLRVPFSGMPNGGDIQAKDFGPTTMNGNSPRSTTITPNGVSHETRSDSVTPTPESKPPLHLLKKDADEIPKSSQLLNPVIDHLQPSKREIFEYALQLRMSQVALTEVTEGAEGARQRWVEIFAWIAEKKGAASERKQVRYSINKNSHLYSRSHTTAVDGWRSAVGKGSIFRCLAASRTIGATCTSTDPCSI